MSSSLVGIAAVFIVYFIWVFYRGRNGFVQPARLSLKAKETPAPAFRNETVLKPEPSILKPESTPSKERHLSIHFNFNGHSFEAHEILGVPQGCSLVEVEKAYQQALLKNQSDSKEFLEMALIAIQKSHEKRKTQSFESDTRASVGG